MLLDSYSLKSVQHTLSMELAVLICRRLPFKAPWRVVNAVVARGELTYKHHRLN